MNFHPESLEMRQYILDSHREFANPIDMVCSANPQLNDNNSKELMGLSLTVIAFYLSNIDDEISVSEIDYYRDIYDLFVPQNYQISSASMLDKYRTQIKKNYQTIYNLNAPFVVTILDMYDKVRGTNYGEKARVMFFRFANAFIKVDGKITPKEEEALMQFKGVLFPQTEPSQSLDEGNRQQGKSASTEHPVIPLEQLTDQLNSLIGLQAVKNDVIQLVNFLKVQKMRGERGMASVPVSRHLVFYGNPGTGKTTVARLLAQIYRSLNVISKGHLIETDRSGLVAGYVGQTALKVKDVVEKSLGGILFIDEAYSLVGEGQDYGSEAIDTLIKLMEDNRDDLIVIVAGYTDKMSKFLSSNPGLTSRFNKFFSFDDYIPPELTKIFESFCKEASFKLTDGAKEKIAGIFQILYDTKDEKFGNARLARNLFEQTINNQANRIISIAQVNDQTLSTIEAADLPGDVEIAVLEKMS